MSQRFAVLLLLNLLANAFGRPAEVVIKRGLADNEVSSTEVKAVVDGQEASAPAATNTDNKQALTKNSDVEDEDDSAPPSPDVIKEIFGTQDQEPNTNQAPDETLSSLPDDGPSPVDDDSSSDNNNNNNNEDDDNDDDDDDDDDFEPIDDSSSGAGGSNILSLLSLVTNLFPNSSGNGNITIQKLLRELVKVYVRGGFTFSPGELLRQRRDTKDIDTETEKRDVTNNEVDVDDIGLKPPPLQRQEEDNSSSESSNNSEESLEDDDAAEESLENPDDPKEGNGNERESDGDSDDDSDEPPDGSDGQGGGILGVLAGLSGGEDGQSDLGSLLAAVSGIVVNLSGDGIDVNALIASGIGLFVGLLSEGEENPGAVIASYLLTSLDTLTGGGAKNNGAFFGTFLSKLVKGTSAGGDPDASSEENGNKMPMADSSGFILSFIMGLLGDMSKGSSNPHPW